MAEETKSQQLGPENERGMAALAYLFTWITGLIVFFTAKKEEKYKRWHAIQAIGVGVVVVILYAVVNFLIVGVMLSPGAGAGAAGGAFLVTTLLYLAILAWIIVMMVTAYQGKTLRLPVLAGFADKNA